LATPSDEVSVAGITRKTVEVELRFQGNGSVQEKRPGVFAGTVQDPDLGGAAAFHVWPELLDENGIANPPSGSATVEGSFQISLEGSSAVYRELGRYLLGIAELDTSADPDFHEHHELTSADGRTRLHLILRKRASGT
jgi:hypothetical protein